MNINYDKSLEMGACAFLGTADKGDPEYDVMPPEGVAKIYYHATETRNQCDGLGLESTRCGFFKCDEQDFARLMKAHASWNAYASWGSYQCIGVYPVARSFILPDRTSELKEATKRFFSKLGMGGMIVS